MKPKDLKTLYSWEERKIAIEDGVFYIPSFYSSYTDFNFPGWEAVFQNQNPINVEFCSGNGAWILQKAKESPQINWVAVDLDFGRIRQIWAKVKNYGLKNLFIVCGDATLAAKYFFPKNSIANVFINFPDPWPKNKHARRRLLQRPFVQDVVETMIEGAAFTLATDDPVYSDQAIRVLTKIENLKSVFDTPYFAIHLPGYGSSYFEELWRSKGKSIRYHQFTKALFPFTDRNSTSREGSDIGIFDEGIASAISEEKSTIDDPFADGRKLTEKGNKAFNKVAL